MCPAARLLQDDRTGRLYSVGVWKNIVEKYNGFATAEIILAVRGI